MNTDSASINLGFKQSDSPLGEQLINNNGIACYVSEAKPITAISDDLCSIKWGNCAYGASDCKVYPFHLNIDKKLERITAADVLHCIKATSFKSDHIDTLNCEWIEFPGYHPGTNNDEIHNNPECQNIYIRSDDSDDDPDSLLSHDALKRMVVNGKLWYILLHSKKHQHGDSEFCDYVCLFAVGKSVMDNSLIGVVTYQVCHNLCD